ncbi:hypothetical protein UN63_01760 [Oceanisphaera arctica]|uniref:Glycosyltransferase 2-like domain-containing protein n=2 Tax=Oceanisphaera arctica TaxID=641510 RepID=A0A2P5TR44_9GAMM|nr:hypothetical protein UN63_01760 [Oceanisphaera arctica]
MLPLLQALPLDENASEEERASALWALARRAAWKDSWPEVIAHLQTYINTTPGHDITTGIWLLSALGLQHTGQHARALQMLIHAQALLPEETDLLLAQANIEAHASTTQLALINRVFLRHGLSAVSALSSSDSRLDGLQAIHTATAHCSLSVAQARVSVIMPVYNAADYIVTALRALAEQTWPELELILVDDASQDNTLDVVHNWLKQYPLPLGKTLRILKQNTNDGAYAARNAGLTVASGAFITTHDSDDWSHPQKIEHQVLALLDKPQCVASISYWVRATPDLQFSQWRAAQRWTERNESSLLFRRQVIKKTGYWDKVRVAADSEYLLRIQAAFGADSVIEVLPKVPLSIGRVMPSSLTQLGETHLVTQLNGVRKFYIDAARRWHAATAHSRKGLYLTKDPVQRPFLAPETLCCEKKSVHFAHSIDLIQQSSWFSADWYSQNYTDLLKSTIDPALHYYHYGAAEGRDPGPAFSASGYVACYSSSKDPITYREALPHFLSIGHEQGYKPCPQFPGVQPEHSGHPWVMVCGHQADQTIFGAERCLLDVLAALSALRVNVLVTLPTAVNENYVANVRQHCHRLVVLPYSWWHASKATCPHTLDLFTGLLKQYSITQLLANTLVLDEPILAAKQCNVAVAWYVHELIESDSDLCTALGATAPYIQQRVAAMADLILANSQAVANCWPDKPSVIVPNVVNTSDYDLPFPRSHTLRVALISSNLPKKGLHDFVQLAQLLAESPHAISFLLIGPANNETTALKARQAAGQLTENLIFIDYMPTATVLAQTDIVLNVSHVQESFGRTILEAMAASRPVICYDWGALPELVIHGESGFLAPMGDIAQVAEYVSLLAADETMRIKMGLVGKNRAQQLYSPEVMQQALATMFQPRMASTF